MKINHGIVKVIDYDFDDEDYILLSKAIYVFLLSKYEYDNREAIISGSDRHLNILFNGICLMNPRIDRELIDKYILSYYSIDSSKIIKKSSSEDILTYLMLESRKYLKRKYSIFNPSSSLTDIEKRDISNAHRYSLRRYHRKALNELSIDILLEVDDYTKLSAKRVIAIENSDEEHLSYLEKQTIELEYGNYNTRIRNVNKEHLSYFKMMNEDRFFKDENISSLLKAYISSDNRLTKIELMDCYSITDRQALTFNKVYDNNRAYIEFQTKQLNK